MPTELPVIVKAGQRGLDMLWTMLLAGCSPEVMTVSVHQWSDVVVPGIAEIPDVPLEQLEQYGIDPDELDPGAALGGLLGDFDETVFDDYGVEQGDVTGVYVGRLTLEVIDPPGVDLTFLDQLELWISADDVPEQQIAGRARFLPGEARVELVRDPVDLAPFALGTGMSIRTVAGGLPPEVDATIRATIEVEASVTGAGLIGQLESR